MIRRCLRWPGTSSRAAVSSRRRWRPRRGPPNSIRHVATSSSGCRSHTGHAYAILWLRPLKKQAKRGAVKVPQYIAAHSGRGDDAYFVLRRLVQLDPVPADQARKTPLFRRWPKSRGRGAQSASPRHMSVNMLRALVRSRMRALGEKDVRHWGANSCRIGGATDLGSSKGASPLLLQARGRWASDIGKIYNRMTRQALLSASKMMYGAPKARDLEEIFPDFAQPV